MPISVKEQIEKRTHVYRAHGPKALRRRHVELLKGACKWIAMVHHVNYIDQIGKRHVIDFYRNNRGLSGSVLMDYFCSFELLWEIIGRSDEPPRPRLP